PISCPDNLAFDNHGLMWISTDGNALGSNDGLYAVTTEGKNRGELKCFLTVPVSAETCGPIVTDERVMVNVQHPGESDDATFAKPTSNWPDGGNSTPRPAVVTVWRTDGNIGIQDA
ncbi:MAG: alkaline phosphatase PhoX, partial [Corynebacterium casei]